MLLIIGSFVLSPTRRTPASQIDMAIKIFSESNVLAGVARRRLVGLKTLVVCSPALAWSKIA